MWSPVSQNCGMGPESLNQSEANGGIQSMFRSLCLALSWVLLQDEFLAWSRNALFMKGTMTELKY